MPHALSRRNFLGWLGSAAATTPAPAPASPPPRAWIILERHWEFNDEFSYPEGTSPRPDVFYDPAQAETACQRLNDAFYAGQTPEEFEPDWDEFFPDRGRDFDESTVTWAALRAAGFPDPYLVQELTASGEAHP